MKPPQSGTLKELLDQVGTKLHEQYSDVITAQQEAGDSIVLEVVRTSHYGSQDCIFPMKQTAPKDSLEAELCKSLKRSRGRARHFAGFLVVGNQQKTPVSPYDFITYRIIDLDVPYRSKILAVANESAPGKEASSPTAEPKKKTMRQRIYDILQSSDAPMENAQIAHALATRNGGSPKKLAAAVSAYLTSYPEFKRVSRGVYTIERPAQRDDGRTKESPPQAKAAQSGDRQLPFPYNRWASFTELSLSGNAYDRPTILRHAEKHPDLIQTRTQGKRLEIMVTASNAHLIYRDSDERPAHALTVTDIMEEVQLPREFINAHIAVLGEPVHGRDGLLGYHPHRVEALKVLYESTKKG